MMHDLTARVIGASLGALLLAAALALSPTRATAGAVVAEFSSQHDPRASAVRQGQSQGGVRGGPPAGFRGAGPRPPGFPGAAPRAMPGVPGAGFRGPVVAPGGGYRGPAVGYRGPVGVTGFRGGRAAFIRGRHHVRRGGLVLPLVGLGVLGGLYVGSRYYTPYAYVDGPVGSECVGPTDDGLCELRLTEVPLEGGGAELQCVAYCPQQ
jgi:hypothetical protein